MTLYRKKAILEFMHQYHRYLSINTVAEGLGMSWVTAKKDLEYLEKEKFVIKRKIKRKLTKDKYMFNFRKKK